MKNRPEIKDRYKAIIFVLIAMVNFNPLALAQEKTRKDSISSNPALIPVKFYQKFLSGVDGNRCPMYPTCSRFCIEAVQKHGLFKGWIMTCDRLMRCGRDEIRVSRKLRINGKTHCYDPVDANDFWWKNKARRK